MSSKKENFEDIVRQIKPKFNKGEPTNYFINMKTNRNTLYILKSLKMLIKKKPNKRVMEEAIKNLYHDITTKGKEYVAMKILLEKIKIYIENIEVNQEKQKEKEAVIQNIDELTLLIESLHAKKEKGKKSSKKRGKDELVYVDTAPSLFENQKEFV